MENLDLLRKYNVAGPRYTSYPTVPYWSQTPSTTEWKTFVKETFSHSEQTTGISLYIHLPYCESLCTYCGCHKSISRKHDVEMPYIQTLIKEWHLYLKMFDKKPLIKEIHLGGGTPTFFSPENLQYLIKEILKYAEIANQHEFSFEGHPNNTTKKHLEALFEVGFKRVSFGIQDFDPKVQKAINRIQTFESVQNVTQYAREVGYTSINFDLIYGLPFQTVDSIQHTFDKVNQLHPDRIAFYSYAHIPWKEKAQRLFTDADLPQADEKRALYEFGREILAENDYHEIGMDHFAKKSDPLYIAYQEGTLHRNFMGYTTNNTKLLVGLGASSISDAWGAYIQNEKNIKVYQQRVEKGELPFFRGHVLSSEDLIIKQHILNLMCQFKTAFDHSVEEKQALSGLEERLQELENDGLLAMLEKGLLVAPKGKTFVRNACMALDKKLWMSKPQTQLFSATI